MAVAKAAAAEKVSYLLSRRIHHLSPLSIANPKKIFPKKKILEFLLLIDSHLIVNVSLRS